MASSIRQRTLFFFPLLIGIFIGIVFILIIENFSFNKNFLSPFISSPEILSTKIPSKKPIIGFLPYWNVSDPQIQYHLIDWLAYFDVGLNADGTIKKMEGSNLDMGWYWLSSGKVDQIFETCDKADVKKMLIITAFNNETIDTLVSNENSKKNAIKSIKTLVEEYNFQGVNLDFEYNSGSTIPIQGNSQNYNQFIIDLKKAIPEIEISVCLYANGFIKNFPYQVEKLSEADHLIIMGYDFHGLYSTIAGPVAPLKSSTGPSITQAIQSAIDKKIDLDKVILAMPFYGYEWQTVTQDYKSPTYDGSGAMASYRRVHKLIDDQKLEINWNDEAMSPWLFYQDEIGRNKQIYFENDDSISYKLELVSQANLGGVAIWALGYEGKDASVWQVIEKWRIK